MGKTNGLHALELAQLLVKEIFQAVEELPASAPASLKKQLCDAANSIAANIAEGFGRGTVGERRYHLRVGRGSLEELQSHWKVCRNAEFVETKRFLSVWNRMTVLQRMIVKLSRKQ
jgi:four helix bundle protein